MRALVSVAAVPQQHAATDPSKKQKRHKDKPRRAHRQRAEIVEDDDFAVEPAAAETPVAAPVEAPDDEAGEKHGKHDDDGHKHDGKEHADHGKGHGNKN